VIYKRLRLLEDGGDLVAQRKFIALLYFGKHHEWNFPVMMFFCRSVSFLEFEAF